MGQVVVAHDRTGIADLAVGTRFQRRWGVGALTAAELRRLPLLTTHLSFRDRRGDFPVPLHN